MVIIGKGLKNLQVRSSFYNTKNESESWVKIFVPKLETFCWLHNELPKKCWVHSFPFLVTSSIDISHRRPVNMTMAKITRGMVLSAYSSQESTGPDAAYILPSNFEGQSLYFAYFLLGLVYG